MIEKISPVVVYGCAPYILEAESVRHDLNRTFGLYMGHHAEVAKVINSAGFDHDYIVSFNVSCRSQDGKRDD